MPSLNLVLLLATGAGSPPRVFIAASQEPSPCEDSLAQTLAQQRPDLRVVRAAPERATRDALVVSLRPSPSGMTLTIAGANRSIERDLPSRECTEAVETAVWIIDSALDEPAQLPKARPLTFAVQVGGGVGQGVEGAAATLLAGARGHWQRLCADLQLDGALPNGSSVTANGNTVGSASVAELSPSLAGGVAFPFGPGELAAEAGGGAIFAWGSASSAGQALTGLAVKETTSGFALLRLDYTLGLWAGLLMGLRLEERFVPQPGAFIVTGATPTLSIPQWGFAGWLFAGYHFR